MTDRPRVVDSQRLSRKVRGFYFLDGDVESWTNGFDGVGYWWIHNRASGRLVWVRRA